MFIKLIRHVIIGSILFIITAAFANISVLAAEIYTDIYPKAVTIGDIFELNILVADINDLHSISMSIRYNTDILQVVDTDGNEVTDLPVHYDDIFLGYENEIDTYINTFDIQDQGIIRYEISLSDSAEGVNYNYDEVGEIGTIFFKVKDDAYIPAGIIYEITDILDRFNSGEANIFIKMEDSNADIIDYDVYYYDYVDVYDPEYINGEIVLEWSGTENWDEYDFTDLDTHFFIPDINYPDWPYDVCFWDGGSLAFTPNAILINDGWQDEFQNGIETVFYNRLRPGSVFSVDIFGLALPLKTEASVEVRVDNITVTLSDAEMPVIIDPGKSYWWHVFYVDLSGNIVIINEVNDNEPELDDLTQKIIDLSWYSDYDLDLDGHFFVPSLSDSKIYFDVNWNNEGKINYFPFANYLYDDYGYSGNEYIGVDQIVSGSEFCVNLFSIDETEEIFPVDLTDIEVKFNNQTFNIENATGTGKWWHVFKVNNNGSEITTEPMNLINNTPPGTNITYVHHNVDTSEVEVELSNGNEEDVYGKLLIAHYDSRGAMKDICIKDAFINGMNTTIYIFDGFESIQPDELIKVFLWDGISGIKPLTYEYRY